MSIHRPDIIKGPLSKRDIRIISKMQKMIDDEACIANNNLSLAEQHESKANSLQYDVDYYKRAYEAEREKVRAFESSSAKAEANGEARRNYRIDAMIRAQRELGTVKANEDQCTILQRAIGNAQGILAAALQDEARPIDLYPAEKPPRRRSGDMRHDLDTAAYIYGGRNR